MNYDEAIKKDKQAFRNSFVNNMYSISNYHREMARRHHKRESEVINDLIADILEQLDRYYYLYPNSRFDVDLTGELKNLWLEKAEEMKKDHD